MGIKHSKILANKNIKMNIPLYIMLIPAFCFVFVFNYVPMYGIIIAFQDYQPSLGFMRSPFVGFKWFRQVATMPDFMQILYNTLFIAILKMFFGQLVPIIFALLLNEVHNVYFKRSVQTLVYLPNFLSWVVIGGIFIDLLSLDGVINQGLNMFGIRSIFFLGSNQWFRMTMIITDIWKGFGWGAILYLAALSGINSELYEAAVIDGANRLKQTWHVTLPGISATIILLATLSLGGILNAGFEQILMMYNPAVYQTGDILDTFIYRAGLLDAQFSLATAIGFFRSAISFTLIILSYKLAYKLTDYRIF